MVTKLLPVNIYGNYFVTIGARLREERERLEFPQPAFAALAGTTKKSQIDYEKDLTQPKAGYLSAIAKVGADIQYIVTGKRAAVYVDPEINELISLYRKAPLAVRHAVIGALTAGVPPSSGSKITIHGNVGEQINTKSINDGKFTVNMGDTPKKK